MNRIIYALIFVLCVCIGTSCISITNKKEMKTEDKYQWSAGFKCPEMYPIQLGWCRFVFDDRTEDWDEGGVRVGGRKMQDIHFKLINRF